MGGWRGWSVECKSARSEQSHEGSVTTGVRLSLPDSRACVDSSTLQVLNCASATLNCAGNSQVIDDAHVLCTTGVGPGQKSRLGYGPTDLKPGNTDGVRVHDILQRSMDYRNLLYLTSKPAMETLDDM